jgi:hypothetical protein
MGWGLSALFTTVDTLDCGAPAALPGRGIVDARQAGLRTLSLRICASPC